VTDENNEQPKPELPRRRPQKRLGRVSDDEQDDNGNVTPAFEFKGLWHRVRISEKTSQAGIKAAGAAFQWAVVILVISVSFLVVCIGIARLIR
jgi:hypothetical protein